MLDSGVCPQCGLPLRADAPEGLCPECLLIEAMQSIGDSGAEHEAGGGDVNEPKSPPKGASGHEHFPQGGLTQLTYILLSGMAFAKCVGIRMILS